MTPTEARALAQTITAAADAAEAIGAQHVALDELERALREYDAASAALLAQIEAAEAAEAKKGA